jgi:putative PIG3 family NAD(P)H quinone oxidoreductase
VPATILESMRAVEIATEGGPEVLRVVRRPVPQPAAGELLIRIAAAGVNRVDVFQRLGIYRPPAGTTDIPGVEFAGEVVALGPGARRYRVGDRVCALVTGGGYAEYCVAPEVQVLPVPAGFDMVKAAGIMETFCTVWTALYDHGRFNPGESILVHGGSSGIGTTAIMLARADGAPAIFATAGTAEKCAACERIGATRAINYRTEDFEAVVRDATGGAGVDVIIDIVAGDYVPKNIALLKPDGRLVFVGRMSQKVDVAVNVLRIMYQRLVVTGVSLRGQSVERKRAIVDALARRAWPLFENGAMAPLVDRVFPLAAAADAHRRLEASDHVGKLILAVTQ